MTFEPPQIKGQRVQRMYGTRYGETEATIECTNAGAWTISAFARKAKRMWRAGDVWLEDGKYRSENIGPFEDFDEITVHLLAE